MFHLYTPWKNKKTCNFLMFSGGMGLKIGLKPFYDKFIIYHSQVTIQLCENTFYNVKNRSTRRKWDICSKLIIKTPQRRHWRRYGAFITSFAHISHLILVFPVLAVKVNAVIKDLLDITYSARCLLVLDISARYDCAIQNTSPTAGMAVSRYNCDDCVKYDCSPK